MAILLLCLVKWMNGLMDYPALRLDPVLIMILVVETKVNSVIPCGRIRVVLSLFYHRVARNKMRVV